jgi:hypothetical protein
MEMSEAKVYRVLDKSGSPLTTVLSRKDDIFSHVEKQLKNRPGGRHSAWQAWQAGGQMVLDQETKTFFSVGTNPQSVSYFANQYRKATKAKDEEQAMGIYHHVEDKLGHYASVEFYVQVSDIDF